MKLEGSCHCKAVRFTLESHQPVPYMRCYCSICRKTVGTGGYAINLGGDHRTLKVRGEKHLGVYRARMEPKAPGERSKRSTGRRHFCVKCGTALWLWDPTWPDLVHPHAGAIDTELPAPPRTTHIMLGSKPGWVGVDLRPGDEQHPEYPEESLAEWHDRHGQTR